MVEHKANVVVAAPAHQVYELFSHFNDYPKFMSHVLEVTYYDDKRSHWVVDIEGRHEWDAVNDGWQQDRAIGWRSTDGLKNSGLVTFTPAGDDATQVTVLLRYDPPGGVFGDVGEKLGGGRAVETALQRDLENFAQMVREAPPGALDPTSSAYLFHRGSAAERGKTTKRQDQTMPGDVAEREAEGMQARAAFRDGEEEKQVETDRLGDNTTSNTN